MIFCSSTTLGLICEQNIIYERSTRFYSKSFIKRAYSTRKTTITMSLQKWSRGYPWGFATSQDFVSFRGGYAVVFYPGWVPMGQSIAESESSWLGYEKKSYHDMRILEVERAIAHKVAQKLSNKDLSGEQHAVHHLSGRPFFGKRTSISSFSSWKLNIQDLTAVV